MERTISNRRVAMDQNDKQALFDKAQFCPVCGKKLLLFSGNSNSKVCPASCGLLTISRARDGGQFVIHFKEFKA